MFWILFIGFILVTTLRLTADLHQEKKFRESNYALQTGNSMAEVLYDRGKFGEAGLYFALQDFEKEGARFLFNLYIPKANGQTTEIDILMI